MTTLIRTEAPRQSIAAFAAISALVLMVFFFLALVAYAMITGLESRFVGKVLVGVWLAMIFFIGAVIVDIYRKEFVPDELIHKTRRPKIVPRREIR